MTTYKKTCKQCREEFECNHASTLYCSKYCSRRYHQLKHQTLVDYPERYCKICYKVFKPRMRQHVICSDACRLEKIKIKMAKIDKREKQESKARAQELMDAILENPRQVLDQIEPSTAPIRTRKKRETPPRQHLKICRRCGNTYTTTGKASKFCYPCHKTR